MPTLSKIAYALAAVIFLALVTHSRSPETLGIASENEMAIMFFLGGAVALGIIFLKDDSLPFGIRDFWFGCCTFSVVAMTDTALGLGNVKGGMLTLFPFHIFTAYGTWIIYTHDEGESRPAFQMWAAVLVTFLLLPFSNYR